MIHPVLLGKRDCKRATGTKCGEEKKEHSGSPGSVTRGRRRWMMCMIERFLSGLRWQRKRTRYSGCKGMFGVNVASTRRSVSHFSEHHPSTWAEEKAARRDHVKAQVLFSTKPKSEWNVLLTCDSRQKEWTQILWTKWKSSDEFNGCIAGVRTKTPLRVEDNVSMLMKEQVGRSALSEKQYC